MIIGLLGPSCSGKSFFLNLLCSSGFHVPMSVTTRPQREEDVWHLRYIDRSQFESLNERKGLCFVTEAFGHSYACIEFSEEVFRKDIAIIITKGNIPELSKRGGLVVQILPLNPQEAMRRIQLLGRGNQDQRIRELYSYFADSKDVLADRIFYNDYTMESRQRFLDLVNELKGK